MRELLKAPLFLIVFAWSLQADSIHFIFVGDTGTGDSSQYLVASAMQKYCAREACDFLLLLGDNFYPSGVKSDTDPQWQKAVIKPYEPLNIPIYPVLGNHDYEGNVVAQIDFSKKYTNWVLPNRYHTFVRSLVQFFILDSNKMDKTQVLWLETELKKSTAKWKIAAEHHPIYSYGVHGNGAFLIKYLRPYLLNQLDFMLTGHDHDKQVLRDPNDLFLHYIVSGAGASTRPSEGGTLSDFHVSSLGFASLTVDENSATLKILNSNADIEFEKRYTPR